VTNKTVAPTTATHHHYNHPSTYRDIIDRDNSKYQSLVRPPESIPVSPRYTILKRVRNWPGVNRDTKSMLSYTMWLRFKVTSNGVSLAEPHACNNTSIKKEMQRKEIQRNNTTTISQRTTTTTRTCTTTVLFFLLPFHTTNEIVYDEIPPPRAIHWN
jgi:hypothetical protein